MRLRWLVLLVALATCLRLSRAQTDPLPFSLVDLVINSPISSMKDLHRLLDDHSIEEEEEKGISNITHKRLPRSLDVQVAQLALCKVRTEVMEVTRSMLDRTNANFLLWPLCVEVQRCSGCCNTRVQCVPVKTETRHLQMTKIMFVDLQPVYEKVIIPVEDHLTCSCKARAASLPILPKATPPSPPRILTKPAISKGQSKEELHRHDDLKHNQRFQLDDQETQRQPKYTLAYTQRTPIPTLTNTHTSPNQHMLAQTQYATQSNVSTRHTTLSTRMMSDTTQHLAIQKDQKKPVPGLQTHRSDSGKIPELQKNHSKSEKVHEHHKHHSDTEKIQEHHVRSSEPEKVLEHRTHSLDAEMAVKQHVNHSDSEKVSGHQTDHVGVDDAMKASSSVKHKGDHPNHQNKTTKQQPNLNHSWTPDYNHSKTDANLQHSGQLEVPIVKYSHVEVIGQSSGQSELTDQSKVRAHQNNQSKTEKTNHHSHHHHHHHNHRHHPERHLPTQWPTQHPHSTVRTVMKAPQSKPSVPHTAPPAISQRKRRRKQRRRMSKSAMRAMIMVMS